MKNYIYHSIKFFMRKIVSMRNIIAAIDWLSLKRLSQSIGKHNYISAYIIIVLACIISFSSCIKDVAPSDSITTEVLTSTTEGLTNAVNGAYALFKDHVEFNGTADDNNMYLRQYYQ